jgi:amino acid transporter
MGRTRGLFHSRQIENRDPLFEGPKWSAVQALIVSAVVSVTVLAASVLLLIFLALQTPDSPEAALSLVFVAATVVLVLVISAMAIVLRRLELTDKRQAMGLPPGSIRAVIALLLITLFFIAAIFLFNRSQNTIDATQIRTLTGISTDRFNGIATADIKSATPRSAGDETVYDVELYPASSNTATSDDLAKQLVTTVGTLVTAVAAFYFGTAASPEGRRRRREVDEESQPVPREDASGPQPDAEPGTNATDKG